MIRKPNWKALAAEATTLPGLQVGFHASVALHTISTQVDLRTKPFVPAWFPKSTCKPNTSVKVPLQTTKTGY